jgi:hypothetical protein
MSVTRRVMPTSAAAVLYGLTLTGCVSGSVWKFSLSNICTSGGHPKDIRKAGTLLKIKIFTWHLAKGRLPSND